MDICQLKLILTIRRMPGSQIQFPSDCIDILRSRPFEFAARSCNRWAVGRVILAGDAAHVFPPCKFLNSISIHSPDVDRVKLAGRASHLDFEMLQVSPGVWRLSSEKIHQIMNISYPAGFVNGDSNLTNR